MTEGSCAFYTIGQSGVVFGQSFVRRVHQIVTEGSSASLLQSVNLHSVDGHHVTICLRQCMYQQSTNKDMWPKHLICPRS